MLKKYLSILFFTMLVASGNTSFATDLQNDCLFNWLEPIYPDYIAPANSTSQTSGDYYYRYYSQTQSYVAVTASNQHLNYLGPKTGPAIVDLGAISGWLIQSGCEDSTGGSDQEVRRLLDKAIGISSQSLDGGVTENVTPILDSLLGMEDTTCPEVSSNLDLNTLSDMNSLPDPILLSASYGSGCTGPTGEVFSGSVELSVNSLVISEDTGQINANFLMTVNDLVKNGELIGDGSASGNISTVLNAELSSPSSGSASLQLNNFLMSDGLVVSGSLNATMQSSESFNVAANLTTSDNDSFNLNLSIQEQNETTLLNSTSAGRINQYSVIFSNVLFDSEQCDIYPISGSVQFSQGGSDWLVTFDDSCDGSYTLN